MPSNRKELIYGVVQVNSPSQLMGAAKEYLEKQINSY
jgi:hypothetical protein